MLIINIRGTHGAGKTSVIRALLAQGQPQPLYGALGPRRPEAYALAGNTFVLGPYESICGGCDAIQPYALIAPLIEKYAAAGDVIFEGSLIASCWGTVGALLERWKRGAIILFLDTPVDECIRRVRTRRLERGDSRPFNPANLIAKHATVARLKQKITAAGIVRTQTVSCESAASVVINILESNADV